VLVVDPLSVGDICSFFMSDGFYFKYVCITQAGLSFSILDIALVGGGQTIWITPALEE